MEKALEILKEHYDEYPSKRCKEAIAELEAMKYKTCDGCVFFDEDQWGADCEECSVRFKNMFKLKDNA